MPKRLVRCLCGRCPSPHYVFTLCADPELPTQIEQREPKPKAKD